MNVLLPLLIVTLAPTAPIEGRYPEATEVFHCAFGEKWDQNYDAWPDNWTRRRGPNYPRYLPIEIIAETTPVGKHCLRIELDGAGAVAYSPPIPVSTFYEYVLEGLVRTQGLDHDRAWISLTFLDAQQKEVDHYPSAKLRDTQGWKKLRLGPIASPNDHVRFVLIGLHLEPEGQADLKGSARFDDLWLGRLPRVALATNSPLQVFTSKDIPVTCKASGFTEANIAINFFLEDVHGTILANEAKRPEVSVAETAEEASATAAEPPPLIGITHWQPPIPGPGFYRLYATMQGRESPHHRPAMSLVVLTPQRPADGSEFGWTLPQGEKPLPPPVLADLLGQAGIRWAKYPVWYDEAHFSEKMAALVSFVESLGSQGIELVGLLIPPDALRHQPARRPLTVAEVFLQDPKIWYPSVELTLARMAVQVRWWQLGDDRERSFVDTPRLADRMSQVKAELDRLGNNVNVGFAWDWAQSLPQGPQGKTPWRFLALSASPPLTPEKLGDTLDLTQETPLQRWVVVEPLPPAENPLDARVDNLLNQMMAANIHHAQGVFLADPFDPTHGVMNPDGTPGELFLPWRTTALALGGASFAGSNGLPNESPNRIFMRPKEAVMIVWNRTPQQEVLYLGQAIQQLDPWGRPVPSPKVQNDEEGQAIAVGPLPTFVLAIDPDIVRWRQETSFAKTTIPSIPEVRHDNVLRLKNPTDKNVTGKLRLLVPEGWKVEPQDVPLQLEPNKASEVPFKIVLADDATTGPQKIRVEYMLHTNPPVRFCVYRQIEVGQGDVKIEVTTRREEPDVMEVDQRFINAGNQVVNFRCYLYAPGRRRQTTQIVNLGQGEDRKSYRLSDSAQLLGQTLWLRAEEIGGPRILNYRFVVK